MRPAYPPSASHHARHACPRCAISSISRNPTCRVLSSLLRPYRRLYREAGYRTFEDYCQKRWGWTRQRAHQLMLAAEVSTTVDIPPANEAQARELSRLKSTEAIRETWQEVREERGESVTARDVRETGYQRFEDYCRERWGWKRAHAYRLIDSAQVAGALSPIGDKAPANEAQARELSRLKEPEIIRETWQGTQRHPPESRAGAIELVVMLCGWGFGRHAINRSPRHSQARPAAAVRSPAAGRDPATRPPCSPVP
ncbi:hypothetical protein NITHO_3110002 [Nitrolancea hollandica Lb]|uniref:Uncharacterized protein n=1 Tax=Nitrolancea hollandica Lb TaxID=1129897 RepID=I4EHG7_9BACT|nr:hypothetical protein NITHO_3110002 [Nitrolancea hollandica Lb]